MISKMKINGEIHDIEDANAVHRPELEAYSTTEEVQTMISQNTTVQGQTLVIGQEVSYGDYTN